MNKVFKGFAIALSVVCVGISGIFIANEVVNAVNYNPFKNPNYKYAAESLLESLYPDVCSANVYATREKTLNFGGYKVTMEYSVCRNGGVDTQGSSSLLKNGRFAGQFDMIVAGQSTVTKEELKSSASFLDMKDDEYYTALFKVNEDITISDATYVADKYEKNGKSYVEWVGYSIDDFDTLLGKRINSAIYGYKAEESVFYMLKSISPENEAFLKEFYAFEALKEENFSSFANKWRDGTKVACVSMRATGEELKYFKEESSLTLVSFH